MTGDKNSTNPSRFFIETNCTGEFIRRITIINLSANEFAVTDIGPLIGVF